MKTYWGVEVQHTLISLLKGGSVQLHALAALPTAKVPITHWMKDWVGPRADLAAVTKTEINPSPAPARNRTSVTQPVTYPLRYSASNCTC